MKQAFEVKRTAGLGLSEVLEVVRVWSRLLPPQWAIIGSLRYFVIEK
jgi:hypothetical protein